MSNVEQLITTIEETMQDLLETMNPENEAIYDKLADAVNTYREAIAPKPSLDKLVEDIEELVLSDKEYSHNIIGLKLELIEKHYGVEKAEEDAKWAGMEVCD